MLSISEVRTFKKNQQLWANQTFQLAQNKKKYVCNSSYKIFSLGYFFINQKAENIKDLIFKLFHIIILL